MLGEACSSRARPATSSGRRRRLDASRFERLVADAAGRPPDEAASCSAQRCGCGAAPPLADFAYEPFAQSEIARLEEARLGALEERIDADLDRGRHATVVAELEALVAEHPFRERLIAELMLALYRCGRQTEALERLPPCAAGARPGARARAAVRSLRELEQQILGHDPRSGPHRAPTLSRRGSHVKGTGSRSRARALVVAAAVTAGWELTRGSGAAVTIIDPGISPGSIAVERDVGWATNAATSSVSRIDLRMNTRAGTVSVGDSPAGIRPEADSCGWRTASAGVSRRSIHRARRQRWRGGHDRGGERAIRIDVRRRARLGRELPRPHGQRDPSLIAERFEADPGAGWGGCDRLRLRLALGRERIRRTP